MTQDPGGGRRKAHAATRGLLFVSMGLIVLSAILDLTPRWARLQT